MKRRSVICTGRLPFRLETPLEHKIAADPEFRAGLEYGQPRPGHPEGKVAYHIRDVLHNIDHFFPGTTERSRLRLIGLIHDTFKNKTAGSQLAANGQSHGYWARKFAERYLADEGILEVIELHDEAYKASRWMTQYGDQQAAERAARALIARLGNHLALFMCFYLCDNRTGDKSSTHYAWFQSVVEQQTERRTEDES